MFTKFAISFDMTFEAKETKESKGKPFKATFRCERRASNKANFPEDFKKSIVQEVNLWLKDNQINRVESLLEKLVKEFNLSKASVFYHHVGIEIIVEH